MKIWELVLQTTLEQ